MHGAVPQQIQEDQRLDTGRRLSAHQYHNHHVAQADRDQDREDRVDTVDIRGHHAPAQLKLLPHEAGHTHIGQLREGHSLQPQVEPYIERHGLHQDPLPYQADHLLHRGQGGHFDVALLPPQYQRLAQAFTLQRRLCADA